MVGWRELLDGRVELNFGSKSLPSLQHPPSSSIGFSSRCFMFSRSIGLYRSSQAARRFFNQAGSAPLAPPSVRLPPHRSSSALRSVSMSSAMQVDEIVPTLTEGQTTFGNFELGTSSLSLSFFPISPLSFPPNKKKAQELKLTLLPFPSLPSQILHRSQLNHLHPKMAFHQNRSLLRLVRYRRSHRLGNLHHPNRSLRRPRTSSHSRTRSLPGIRKVPVQGDLGQLGQQVLRRRDERLDRYGSYGVYDWVCWRGRVLEDLAG